MEYFSVLLQKYEFFCYQQMRVYLLCSYLQLSTTFTTYVLACYETA